MINSNRHISKFLVATAALAISLMACSEKPKSRLVTGDDPTLISFEQARRSADEFIRQKGYQSARCVEEAGGGQFVRMRYETNNVLLPHPVLVDRKFGKVRFDR
jgi:hypothetical protein